MAQTGADVENKPALSKGEDQIADKLRLALNAVHVVVEDQSGNTCSLERQGKEG